MQTAYEMQNNMSLLQKRPECPIYKKWEGGR